MKRATIELGGAAFLYLMQQDGELVIIKSFNSSPPSGYTAISNIYFAQDEMELVFIT